MARALQMAHERDPKDVLREAVWPYIENMQPMGVMVMLAVYQRKAEQKTASGLIIAGNTAKEDAYQGKCGLVLKAGPAAFIEDEDAKFGGVVPKPGDWVITNVGETFAFDLPNGERIRLVEDVRIKCIVPAPDLTW